MKTVLCFLVASIFTASAFATDASSNEEHCKWKIARAAVLTEVTGSGAPEGTVLLVRKVQLVSNSVIDVRVERVFPGNSAYSPGLAVMAARYFIDGVESCNIVKTEVEVK